MNWDQQLQQAIREASRLEKLERQIEAVLEAGRRDPNLDNTGVLRELGRQHYELTGTGGRAV